MSVTLVEWIKGKYAISFITSREPLVGMKYVNMDFETDGDVYSRQFAYSSSENSDFINNYLFSIGYRRNLTTRKWSLVEVVKNEKVRSVRCHRLKRKM